MRKRIRAWLSVVACLALAFGVHAQSSNANQRPNLTTMSGSAWMELTRLEQNLFISGILLGSQYVSEKYDRMNRPDDPVVGYMSHLFYISNDDLRMTLDRIYQVRRYWQVPIIKVIFEHKLILEELSNGDPIQTIK